MFESEAKLTPKNSSDADTSGSAILNIRTSLAKATHNQLY